MLEYKPTGLFLLKKTRAVEIPLQGLVSSSEQKFHHLDDEGRVDEILARSDLVVRVIIKSMGFFTFCIFFAYGISVGNGG